MILGGLAFAFAVYYIYDTAKDWWSFRNTASFKTIGTFIAITIAIAIPGGVFALVFFKVKYADPRLLFTIALTLIAIALVVAIESNAAKYLWSRPRPRFIFNPDSAVGQSTAFRAFWELSPFKSFDDAACDGVAKNLHSFPSGHTGYSTIGIFLLPMVTLTFDKTKENRLLQLVLFYVALLWAVASGVSRVYAGAHWLSDTGAGLLFTTIVGTLIIYIADYVIERKSKVKEDYSA